MTAGRDALVAGIACPAGQTGAPTFARRRAAQARGFRLKKRLLRHDAGAVPCPSSLPGGPRFGLFSQ